MERHDSLRHNPLDLFEGAAMNSVNVERRRNAKVKQHNLVQFPEGDVYQGSHASRINEMVTRLADDPATLAGVAVSLGLVLGGLLVSFRRPKTFHIKIEVSIQHNQQSPD